MTSRIVEIVNDLGLHLRAAGTLVQVAGDFSAEIWLEHGRMRANAKSIMSVLSLAAAKGVKLRITATGTDEERAIEAIAALIERGFDS